MDEDGATIMAAVSLMAKEVYPRAPTPPCFEECVRICEACPAWLFPQSQLSCVMFGCQRFREKVVSELPPDTRRKLCPLPVDIKNGVSYQIGFSLDNSQRAPRFVAWINGHCRRIEERAWDQLRLLSPIDHIRIIMEYEDRERCLPTYRFFSDVRI